MLASVLTTNLAILVLAGFIPLTASSVTSSGAGRPGTSAVVMTTSMSTMASASRTR